MFRASVLATTLNLFASLLCGHGSLVPQRPFVLIDQTELNHLRDAVARPGWKRSLYLSERDTTIATTGRGILCIANEWLNRPIEIPARGGHYHDFFCVEGDRLEVPPGQRYVPGPYRCVKCGKTYTGQKYEAALRRFAHSWLAQAALDLALTSQLEQKPAYAAKSAEILLKYAKAYPGPHTGQTTGGMQYQSLDESMWVIPLAQAYDLIYPRLAPDDRFQIEQFLRRVAEGLRKCEVRGNWESWHLSAVGVVGYAIADQGLIVYATDKFKEQIREELGDDGLWPESVHTYHFFPLVGYLNLAEAARHTGIDLYSWEAKPGKTLLSMFTAPLQYAYPDMRLPAINDGWFEAFLPPDLYELALVRTQDPRFAWVLANGYKDGMTPAGSAPSASRTSNRDGLYAFLFGSELPSQTTPPSKTSADFPGLGICILRSTNNSMLTFDYGPFLGHGQRDKMGITLFVQNKLWMADYGTPGYGASILPWYTSTFAHNTVVVDGANQQPTKEKTAQLWLGQPGVEAARSSSRQAYAGVTHTRSVIRVRDYFVLLDQLESDTEHTYDLYLHGEGNLYLPPGAVPHLDLPNPPAPWIEKLTARAPLRQFQGRWSRGESHLMFYISAGSPFTPMAGECPAETGSRKIPLLICRQRATAAEFLTLLVPTSTAELVSAERFGSQIRIQIGTHTDLLTLPSDAGGPSLSP